ncbi:mechanosensitive ion channel family protein [Halomontanus rarus]|uniref:mechanosensitive ion channel family protein n=1 Tax=Halomontanus rarus TaxID=3034020 RepID=UPI0023E8A864|nr:mechanosensitive ion channel family protein [Halovivax sp. TS33]
MSALTRFEELLEVYYAFLDNAATFLLTLALAYVLGRYVVKPPISYALEFRGTERTLRQGIERLVSVGVIVAAVVIALTIAGLDFVLERTAILVAALTVALGFAAQNVVGNLVSGAFIVTDSKFNIGDWIRWEEQEGVIEDISFRATRVRTFDNEVITVPNSTLTQTAVTNAVLNESLRLEVTLEINYDDDVEEALYILRTAAQSHLEILENPEPVVLVTELSEAVQLAGRFWIADPDRGAYGRIRSEYARTVLERFEDAGIDLGRANPQALEGDIGVVPKDGDDENESGSE